MTQTKTEMRLDDIPFPIPEWDVVDRRLRFKLGFEGFGHFNLLLNFRIVDVPESEDISHTINGAGGHFTPFQSGFAEVAGIGLVIYFVIGVQISHLIRTGFHT